jgi:hypothetical protein
MKHLIGAVLFGSIVIGTSGGDAQQKCSPGTARTPEQTARRTVAVRVARQINTAQARLFRTTATYQPLANLPRQQQSPGTIGNGVEPIPSDFDVRVTTDGSGYMLVVKDQLDACAYSVFSDQDGVIYEGVALQ